MNESPPDDYMRFVIEDVRPMGETMTIVYGGHIFGGIVPCMIDPVVVEKAVIPGKEIFVRYHNRDTGAPGQIAHIITRHPDQDGWAELYSDGV